MMELEKAIERAFDRANLIGESVDLDKILLGYKAIRELYQTDEKAYDKIYDDVSARLFGRY